VRSSHLERELKGSCGDREIGARLIERQNALEPRLARSSPVLPILLGRVAVLFSRGAVALEEAREVIPSHADAVLGQDRTEFGQVEAGLRLGEGDDRVGLRRALVRAQIAAHRLGRDAALTGETRPPPIGARQAATEAFGSFVSEGAGRTGRAEDIGALPRRLTLHRSSRFNTPRWGSKFVRQRIFIP
jgi:hypothetical protein